MEYNSEIKALVGLGNPGPTFFYTPHNIGFLIMDKLCELYHGTWSEDHNMQVASIIINDKNETECFYPFIEPYIQHLFHLHDYIMIKNDNNEEVKIYQFDIPNIIKNIIKIIKINVLNIFVNIIMNIKRK